VQSGERCQSFAFFDRLDAFLDFFVRLESALIIVVRPTRPSSCQFGKPGYWKPHALAELGEARTARNPSSEECKNR